MQFHEHLQTVRRSGGKRAAARAVTLDKEGRIVYNYTVIGLITFSARMARDRYRRGLAWG